MDKRSAKERIAHLKKLINRERYLYHVLDKSGISDSALDSLKKELFDLELQFPDLITPDSPTQRIGGEPLKRFEKVEHKDWKGRPRRMNSLNDAFSEEDVRAWIERLDNYFKKEDSAYHRIYKKSLDQRGFYCDLKMDGLAVELVYKNGVLEHGATRGDGNIGEDVTNNLKRVEAIPLVLESGSDFPEILVVRGEIFMSKKEFRLMNKEQEKKGSKIFANPRNAAAGSIRQLDPKIAASRKLRFYAYGLIGGHVDEDSEYYKAYPTHDAEYEALKKYGIGVNPYGKVVSSFEEIFKFHKDVERLREKIDFEIDGIVVAINANEVYDRAGIIGKAPRGAMAYKFSPREATTIVREIKVQVGRTGALTPVAVMDPVRVGGVTITHATLHNADEIERLGLKIGDTVIVSRAGDVIPQVTKVLKELRTGKEKEFKMPAKCPVDNSPVVRDGVIYRCSSRTCGARHRESLYHLVARPAFNIDGLGPKIIDHLLDEGLIADAADIFTLKEGDIAALPGFGEKSAENIVREIEERKNVSLPRFIYALGILHVGEETANLLAEQIPYEDAALHIKKFVQCYQNLSLEKLQEIPDIGPKVAESIYGWFHESRNIKFLEKFGGVGIKIKIPPQRKKNPKFAGKTFVLTGTLESMSREAAKEKVRDRGGDISESVSSKTDYVVVGAEPGSKHEKAKKLGVTTLDEAAFLKLLKEK